MDEPNHWVNPMAVLTQWMGLSMFDPKLSQKHNPEFFRVYICELDCFLLLLLLSLCLLFFFQRFFDTVCNVLHLHKHNV